MVSFDCRFATVGNVDPALLPPADLQIPFDGLGSMSLAELFLRASGGVINLQPNFQFINAGHEQTRDEVSGIHLHQALATVANNPVNPNQPAERLGVILAPAYAPADDVLGIMFDLGFSDPDDPVGNSAFQDVPREGCAIFLHTIWNVRNRDPVQYQKELAFTLVHELSHVFNLQHTSEPCFLNSSPANNPPPDSAFTFLSDQQTMLAECETEEAIYPGGKPFNKLGEWTNRLLPKVIRAVPKRELTLTTTIAQKEFWPWEPVELDIVLKAGANLPGGEITVPDELDPGYRSFTIWIEDPSGERRRYRATKHYCRPPKTKTLKSGGVFQRDISIFGQSGGYTFSQPGEYKIWATFFVSPTRSVTSEKFSFEVKSRNMSDSRAQRRLEDQRRLFRHGSRIFFYRNGIPRRRELGALEEIIRTHRRGHSAAIANYALGRLYFDPHNFPPEGDATAIRYLRRALDLGGLTLHQKNCARECLKMLEQRSKERKKRLKKPSR